MVRKRTSEKSLKEKKEPHDEIIDAADTTREHYTRKRVESCKPHTARHHKVQSQVISQVRALDTHLLQGYPGTRENMTNV
jgi:hypothetical protein